MYAKGKTITYNIQYAFIHSSFVFYLFLLFYFIMMKNQKAELFELHFACLALLQFYIHTYNIY